MLSTALLGASNYSMQCLSSPTRLDVDRCHLQGTWMDIGVPSVRNLRKIPASRIVLWCLIAASSIPLHLLFNSAVFSTLLARDYYATVVTNDFMDLAAQNQTTLQFYSEQIPFQDIRSNAATIQKMDKKACLEAYALSFVSNRANVVLVSSLSSPSSTGQSFVLNIYNITTTEDPGGGMPWICPEDENNRDSAVWSCDLKQAAANVSSLSFQLYDVQYCLSQRVDEHCTVQFSTMIMVIVIMCNVVKLVIMTGIAWKQDWQPLTTLGDAITSFLDEPDPTTKGSCLAWRKSFGARGDVGLQIEDATGWDAQPKVWTPKGHFWFKSANVGSWLVCNGLALITLLVVSDLLSTGLANSYFTNTSLSSLWSLGFGTVTGESLVNLSFPPGSSGLILSILVANSPQLLLSFIYLTYNSLFTCMLLAAEFSSYAHHRKPLRVTHRTSIQRSTYWIQLPYRYSIPLLLVSGTLHWLVSQSIFLARVTVYDTTGQHNPTEDLSTLGYSNIAIIFVIGLGSLVLLVGLAFGFRRYYAGIPLAGSCSAAISAACHPPEGDVKASLKALSWGVVDPGNEDDGMGRVGHCSFTSFEVEAPVQGRKYA